MRTFILKNRKPLIVAAAIIALGVGAFAVYQTFFAPQPVESEEELQTARVRQGDLVLYASGSGTLITLDERDLGFSIGGKVAEINVSVGDEVEAGDTLATQADIDELEAEVASDELNVLNAEQALQELYDQADLIAAQAQLDLANAREALKDAEYDYSVNQQGNRASEATLEAAEAELKLAKDNLEHAKEMLDADPDNSMRQLNYANAEKRYNSAIWSWNWYTGSPTDIQQAQLEAEVSLAKAEVTLAEQAYEEVKDGPDPISIREAELQLSNARAGLAVSQANLDGSTITAPFAGTVMSIDADVGDEVNSAFITVADLSNHYLEIFLDETDMDKIDLDYEVEVVFDAIPEITFKGYVISMDPGLYQSNMITAVRAIVQLDDENNPSASRLMIGMNAAVDVIGGRAENAILVPVEALRELDEDEYAVFVMENGEPTLRVVQVGIQDLTYAEITSGLEAGEVVSTGIVETE
jgi:HlyD family secretion protein